MKILIVGLNYAPEQIGIGPYTAGLAEGLVARGHEVEVIAGKPYYPDWKPRPGPSGVTFAIEHDVRIWRCPHYIPARPSGPRRILHYLSFALRVLPSAVQRAGAFRPDAVVAIAPALMAAPVALLAARRARAVSLLHIQDFEVEAALATGLMSAGPLARLAGWFESAVIRRFDRVTTISEPMVRKARDKGAAADLTTEVRNWAEIDEVRPDIDGSAMRRELGLPDGRIALYSGNLAMKQGIGLITRAARRLSGRADLHFLVCGEGSGRTEFEDDARGLSNVILRPLQPRERLGELLALADVHLLPQIAGAADLVLPSKLTNMLASGRAVVATAAAGTALYDEVTGCGICVAPDDDAGFAAAIERILDDRGMAQAYGEAARIRAGERWSRERILDRFAALIEEAARAKR